MSQIAIDVPAVLSRRVDVRSGVAVVWGQIHAGVAPNAIPMSGFMAWTRMPGTRPGRCSTRSSARWRPPTG